MFLQRGMQFTFDLRADQDKYHGLIAITHITSNMIIMFLFMSVSLFVKHILYVTFLIQEVLTYFV